MARIVSAMNTSLTANLLLFLLVVGGLALIGATIRTVRRDRPSPPAAWSDWREEALWRNIRIS